MTGPLFPALFLKFAHGEKMRFGSSSSYRRWIRCWLQWEELNSTPFPLEGMGVVFVISVRFPIKEPLSTKKDMDEIQKDPVTPNTILIIDQNGPHWSHPR